EPEDSARISARRLWTADRFPDLCRQVTAQARQRHRSHTVQPGQRRRAARLSRIEARQSPPSISIDEDAGHGQLFVIRLNVTVIWAPITGPLMFSSARERSGSGSIGNGLVTPAPSWNHTWLSKIVAGMATLRLLQFGSAQTAERSITRRSQGAPGKQAAQA